MPVDSVRAQAVFLAAVGQDSPHARAVVLDRECGPDAELRARVETLLKADDAPGPFLESRAPALAATVDLPAVTEAPGAMIGPYKLVEPIGEGGMGAVYLALQTEPVKRLVALKVIKAGMDSRQVLARFEAERQALALMDHPNIAKVHEAGTTPDGRPYFVMELVKGVPITRFCDERKLTPRERLELFIPVCQAIQHAHQKGIIHRDIKPTNVLVALYDGKPVPKVIDFGVAKAAGQPLTEKTLVTGLGAVVGTPEYMSPEQAELNQLDIDTRSDVYSLGVLLYELLTGTTPLTRKRIKDAALLEVLRVIREEESQKPSTRLSTTDELPSIAANRGTEPARLSRLMRGELDWVVMKALEKDRSRRYETANGFAADVQRYLCGEAVLAVPPSAGYRLRKFARRNRGGLVTATVLAVAVLAVAGTLGWAVRDRASREQEAVRERAVREAAIQTEVNAALNEAGRWHEQEKWPEALSAVKRAEGLLAGGGGNELRERVKELRKDLEMVQRLEDIRARGSAVREEKRTLARSDQEYADAFREFGLDPDAQTARAAAARITARPGVARALVAAVEDWAFVRGERDQAAGERLMEVAQVADPDPWRQQVREALARKKWASLERFARSDELMTQPPATLYLLGLALSDSGNETGGLEVLRLAQRKYPGDYWINYRLGQKLAWKGAAHADEAISYLRAAIAIRQNSEPYYQLGQAHAFLSQRDEAVVCYRKVIELGKDTANVRNSLGNALRVQKKYDEAIAAFKKAIEIDPNNAAAYNNLGLALRHQKRLDDAIACFNKFIEIDQKNTNAHNNLGLALHDQKKLGEAIAAYKKAIDHDPNNAAAYNNLGNALFGQKKYGEAVAAYRTAIEINSKNAFAYNGLGNVLSDQKKLDDAIDAYRTAILHDPTITHAYNNLGIALAAQQRTDDAIVYFREAIKRDPQYSPAYNSLGLALHTQKKFDEAVAAYQKAIDIDPKSADAWFALGNVRQAQKDIDGAVAAYRTAIENDGRHFGAHLNLGAVLCDLKRDFDGAITVFEAAIRIDANAADAHYNLGICFRNKGRLDPAIASFRKAIEINPKYADAYNNLGNALRAQGKLDEAIAAYLEFIEIEPNNAVSHSTLGRYLLDRPGLDSEAVFHFNAASRLDPRYAEPHYLLGSLRERQGWPEAALARYRKASELGSQDHLDLAPALRRMGDLDGAILHYRKAAESGLYRELWESAAYYSLGELQWEKDLRDEAIASFKRCVQINASINEGTWRPAKLALKLANRPTGRDPAGAVRIAELVIEFTPKDQLRPLGSAWQALAWARYRLGDWKGAIAAINKVKELGSPGDSFEWFLLAFAHKRLGDAKEAREWYDKAVAWIAKNDPQDLELFGLRSEAAALFGEYEIAPPPRGKK